jgi:hypothetical protein
MSRKHVSFLVVFFFISFLDLLNHFKEEGERKKWYLQEVP